MANNIVGSVSAEIILDTKQFEEAISKLKGEVKDIKESFNQKTGSGKGLVDEVKQLKEEIDSLKGKIGDYKNSLKTLREENSNYVKEIEKLNKQLDASKKSHADNVKAIKEEQTVLESASKSAEKYVLNTEKIGKRNTYKKPSADDFSWSSYRVHPEFEAQAVLEGMKNAYFEYDRVVKESAEKERMSWITRQSSMRNAMEAFVGMTRNMAIEQRKAFASEGGYTNLINTISKVRAEFGKINDVNFTKLSDNIYRNGELILSMGEDWRKTQADIVQSTTLIKTSFKQVGEEVEVIRTKIGMVSEVLSTFNFKLIELADRESVAAKRAVELSSAMQRMNTQGAGSWEGRQVSGGYSNYVSQSRNVTETLKQQAQAAKEAKYATEGLSQAYSKINLNSYKANISQVNQALEQQRLRTAQLEAAQASLYYKNAPNNLNTYKMNMDQINQSLERQTGIHKSNNGEIKKGQMSMREFGTTMGKAEAYSNNLYRGLQKVRSVIVSMKTIIGAFGGMAVFSFVTDLIEGAKETYNAKSEMESLLNQNNKVSSEGQKLFNQELDKTVQHFQKINKYSLGETASSIGLEFNLDAKQMAESLDAIAMIQSEYARAGRSNEEAALAVKDILQGEFRRLSMETGIGEEELTTKYGWSGEKEDVVGLMEALRKAGKDRHWDVFAAKATSVGDIVNITKSRFSEFGAELITTIEPALVTGFNGLIEVLDNVKKAFDGMSSFGKLTTIAGVGGGAFVGISTALMMLKRDMGLAQIATLGWGRSFGTALMGLNKTDVALHGFWKTLVATTAGTDAATVSNMNFFKVLAGRAAGVDLAVQKEHGLLSAMVSSKMALKGELNVMNSAVVATGSWHQKLAYLIGNVKATDAVTLKWHESLRKVIFSTKMLKLAVLGITSVAILSWFAGVVAYTDRCKKAMDNLNNINANGAKIADNTQKYIDKQNEKLSELTEGSKEYEKVQNKIRIATNNKKDIDAANELLAIHKREYASAKASIEERKKERADHSLWLASDGKKNISTTNYEWQMQQAIKVRNNALKEYDARLYSASQHVNEQVGIMKKAGASEQKRLDYVREYNAEAENTAQLWKKFHEGDLTSGLYALLSEAKLLWIDLWNNEHFINFWNSVNDTWKRIKPTLDWLVKRLGDLGNLLLDFFSTKQGQIVGGIALLGGTFALIGTKLYHLLGGTKSTIDLLKGLKDKLKDVAGGWKDVKDKAEEANKTMGGDTSTGGIKGEKGGTGSLTGDLKEIGKNRAKSFANNALIIAEGMALVTEAIYMLQAPMWALSETGKYYKANQASLQAGIDGLKLIGPIVVGFLVPIIALHQFLSKYGAFMDTKVDLVNNLKAFGTMALGIAEGLLLVAETIAMIIPSIWALGALGDQFNGMEDQVRKGTEAMKIVSDSLSYLLPFVPALAGGILLGIAIFESGPIGLALSAAVAGGLALGLLLVAETIYVLQAPLWAIGELGNNFKDLSNVQQGAEALKLTAEAMGYVSDAVVNMALIDWTLLADSVAHLVGQTIGIDLTSLTAEGGFLDQLKQFVDDFSKYELTIPDGFQDKVKALATAGESVQGIGDAMLKAKQAMDNLPDEFKNGGASLTYDMETDTTTVKTDDTVQSYFDTFKEPIKQLKTFVDEFNTGEEFNIQPVDTARLDAINSAASMITQINTAVENVKTAMGNIGDAQWNTAYAEGGIFGAAGNWLVHQTGIDAINNGSSSGGYKSSLGSSLKAMEDVISDMFTFQANISQYGGEGGNGESPDVGGLANMITIVQDGISKLSQTLSDGIPQIKENGKSLGNAIVNGFRDGTSGLNSLGNGIPAKIANGIMTNKDMLYNTSNSLGKTAATKFKEGVDPMSEYMTWELSYVKQAMTDRYDELGQTAYDLGSHIAARFKEGDDINSPGIMARSVQDELNYISGYFGEGMINLPQLAFNLADALKSNFNIDFNLGNFAFPNVEEWAGKLGGAIPIIQGFKTQVTTNFDGMKTNVQNSFNNILTKTRNTMTNMQSSTIGHIGNIKTSWAGMQNALIASAEHIKSQTTSKINTLKTNLGDFWNKVKNPDQLIGAAGPIHGPQRSIRRGRRPHFNVPKGNYAGSGGGFNFKPKRNNKEPSDFIKEYIQCLMETGKPCYAGGWNFDWTDKISNKFKGWKTHFAKFHLDDYLNVGKFENDNFPVRGNAEVAKAYIYDVISATQYGNYFNSRFGDDPVAALRAGVFNCWDGANIIIALARAFGFGGGYMGHGSWNGIGHVWAVIPGLGNLDATAIQNSYGFTSPKVTGYAGSIKRGSAGKVPDGANQTTNHNEVHIHIEGPVYGIDDLNEQIDEGARRVARQLFRDNYSGV